jgi:predicted PurR-regulated permease PerM
MIRPQSDYPQSLHVASVMMILALLVAFMYFAAGILIPIAFGALFALLLYPLCKFFEDNGFHRIFAITLTLLVVILFITGLVVLLSRQIAGFIEVLPNIADRIERKLEDLQWFLFKNFNIQFDAKDGLLKSSASKFMDSGVVLLQGTISTFGVIFNILGLVPVYVFLLLLYRTSFRDFILFVSPVERHRTLSRVIQQIQRVVQNYVIGLFTVMAIIAVMNSAALFIIGVDYAIFFGFFAAFLMIIPYIGLIIGSLLPAVFCLLTHDSPWDAVAVIGAMGFIQFLEGNFITPRITGNKVQVNALAAIIALVVGGALWGTAGLIIFMPFVAILKVIFDNVDFLKPYGVLLGTDLIENDPKSMRIKYFIPKRPLKIAASKRKKK